MNVPRKRPWPAVVARTLLQSDLRRDAFYEWRRRLTGEPALPAGPIRTVLLICQGNICRSPFAERCLARYAPDLEVKSAGLDYQGRLASGARSRPDRSALRRRSGRSRRPLAGFRAGTPSLGGPDRGNARTSLDPAEPELGHHTRKDPPAGRLPPEPAARDPRSLGRERRGVRGGLRPHRRRRATAGRNAREPLSMCGIVGIHSLNGRRPIDLALLEAMNQTIVHRGPDSDGRYEDPGHVGLAMRRLSIIDVSGGDQPISNEDGSIWTVFNGEIYHFRELRRNLESRGHRFRTATDTEVIVHAYEEFGDDFVQHLDGMFAFALWDSRRKRLILARDRVGIKQLYYTVRNGQLFWGSEIKCILAHPEVPRELRPSAVHAFPHLSLRARADHGIRGNRRASSRTSSGLREGFLLAAEVLGAALRSGSDPGAGAGGAGHPGPARRSGAYLPDLRRPARRLPVGRHRLRFDGRPDGQALGCAGRDLLDRLRQRGSELRRARIRAGDRAGDTGPIITSS